MQRFKFLIIDDQSTPPESFDRFLMLLQERGYLRGQGNIQISTAPENLGWNLDERQSMHFQVISAQLGGGAGFSFCEAMEYFNTAKEQFDFYLFDLRFMNNEMDPTFSPEGTRLNQCDEARLYQDPDLTPERSTETNKSRYAAGLSFLLQTPLDERPKFIYSAAKETDVLRRVLRIFRSRLRDIFIIDVNPDNYAPVPNQQMREAFDALDAYLRRQIAVINWQSSELRAQLQERVTLARDWDHDDIIVPASGKRHEHLQERWSLRSLFPRQVNLIERFSQQQEQSSAVHAAKQYITEVLEADWRKLMAEGFLNHPTDSRKFNGNLGNAREIVRSLEFAVAPKARQYKPFTQLPAFNNVQELDNLRDFIIVASLNDPAPQPEYLIAYENRQSDWEMPPAQSLLKYFASLQPSPDPHALQIWYQNWVRFCREFGLYPMDIAYISHIAFDNRRHLPGAEFPAFALQEEESHIQFVWSYPRPAEHGIFDRNSKLYYKFETANDAPQTLSNSGLADICKIVCWRYHGTVEIRSGVHGLRAKRAGRIAIEPVESPEALPGTQLIVCIPKPQIET